MKKFLAAALLLVLAAPVSALRIEKVSLPRTAGGAPQSVNAVSGQALVRFSSGTTSAQREAVLRAVGAEVLRELPSVGWTVAGLPDGMPVAGGLALLRGLSGVEKAEPHRAYYPSRTPGDPLLPMQYALSNIDIFPAWEYEVGNSSRVTVAVIDTGIDATHPDLAGKLTGTSQFCDPGTDKSVTNPASVAACVADTPVPACNHATRVSGLAAANTDNGSGIAGISWGAKLISMRVFRDTDCNSNCSDAGTCFDDGTGFCCATDDAAIINALAYLTPLQNTPALGKIVVNMSLGGPPGCGSGMGTALGNAAAAGLVVVIATGNEGGPVGSPADCAGTVGGTGIIPVGATDQTGHPAGFSNYGPELAASGLTAPGVKLETTDLGGGYTGSATGTSFAAPQVAGMAALILSAKANTVCNSIACPQYVQNTLRTGTQDLGTAALGLSSYQPAGNALGAGQLNAFRVMTFAVKGTLSGLDDIGKPFAFPNPFRVSSAGMVSFQIPPSLQGANPNIKLYTVNGEFIRDLNGGLSWNGKNADGNPVASGTYIFLVSSDKGKATGRLAVIR